MVKTRKIRKTDWEEAEQYVKDELDRREQHQFRKDAERIWKEIDRQKELKPMEIVPKGQNKDEYAWRNIIELGELSKAAEIIASDVMRITFPADRRWFDAHVEMPPQVNEEGESEINAKLQMRADRTLRSLMAQQHLDFAFQDRVKLSVLEALFHGSFAAEAVWDSQMMVKEGASIAAVGAPVWVPHSMWNSYPDPSPSIIGANMFYSGSMMFVSYMPKHKLQAMAKGDGWMPARFKDIPDDEHNVEGRKTTDLKIVTYYGDLVMDRNDGDIYLPNYKAMTANGVMVYCSANELPYPSVIYGGYERQDPRNCYYISPVIKLSPTQKLGSKLASRFLDGIDLRTEPPLVYDSNDPQFALNGGPTVAPGDKSGTKGGAEFKTIEVGDPTWALKGLEVMLKFLQEGTGVSSVRSGAVASDRATAYEIAKTAQGGEVRTVEFIRGLTANLRSFLYMQHSLNKLRMDRYSFYNDEMDSQDFQRVSKTDLPESVHFEVTGAKGILGEEQRMNRTTAVTAFAAGSPIFAPLLKPQELLLEIYRDAGQKNPERFLSDGAVEDPRLQQAMQAIQELQAALQEEQAKTEVKMAELQQKGELKQAELQMKLLEMNREHQLKVAEMVAKLEMDKQKMQADLMMEVERAKADQERAQAEMQAKMSQKPPSKVKRRFTYSDEGDIAEVEEERSDG